MPPIRSIPWLSLACVAGLTATLGAQQPAARPADVSSPEAVVKALYECVQRAPGASFQWDRMRTLFLPSARMLPNTEQTGGVPQVLTVNEFTAWVDRGTPKDPAQDRGFAEEEIHTVIERFGDVAHAFSTYQKHFWNDARILGRGINAVQLVFREQRWWIASIAWDEESGAGPVPERYRPKP